MPVITIQISKTSPEKKKVLIEKLTNAAVEVTATPANYFTVFIEEYDGDSIGVGGQTLSEMMAGK